MTRMIDSCTNCEHFKILYGPYGYEWGRVRCEKHNLYAEYKSKNTLNRLTCKQAKIVRERKNEAG